MGLEVLAELREGLLVNVLGDDLQQCVSEQGHVGQQMGVAGTGTILSH